MQRRISFSEYPIQEYSIHIQLQQWMMDVPFGQGLWMMEMIEV
jgi:hypothetical protein